MKALDRGLSQTGGASLEQKPFPLSKDGKNQSENQPHYSPHN